MVHSKSEKLLVFIKRVKSRISATKQVQRTKFKIAHWLAHPIFAFI